MTISALYFLDSKGKTLLSRNYRGDIPVSAVDQFPLLLIAAEQKSTSVPPCLNNEGINYLFITHNDIYVLALSRHNTNAAATLTFLHHLVQTLTEYVNALEEESIRDNFVIIYELLDEMMDFGHAQITDHKILQEFITQESYALDLQARSSSVMTDSISWRPKGIYYKKNELFLDVIESVEFLLGAGKDQCQCVPVWHADTQTGAQRRRPQAPTGWGRGRAGRRIGLGSSYRAAQAQVRQVRASRER